MLCQFNVTFYSIYYRLKHCTTKCNYASKGIRMNERCIISSYLKIAIVSRNHFNIVLSLFFIACCKEMWGEKSRSECITWA